MKKALILLTSTAFLTTTSLHTIACGNSFLEITNDEIYDSPGNTSKINNIALIYMYALPENEQPNHNLTNFHSWDWDWNLNNRKKIIGYISTKIIDSKREFWKVIIQKTNNKGIYVSSHKKSYEPIE